MNKNIPERELSKWVCIARAGAFDDSRGRRHNFSKADLERIRAAYDPARSEAPLVFGHPAGDAPAEGWVRELKRDGEKLLARFSAVSRRARESVAFGRYRYVSMSLAPDKTRLLHVGLLGAAAPAMDGLGRVEFGASEIRIQSLNPEGETMEFSELLERIETLAGRFDELCRQVDELKTRLDESEKARVESEQAREEAEKRASESAAEFAAYRGAVAGKVREERVRALVSSGRLEPAKKESALALAAALAEAAPFSFSAGGEALSAEESYFRQLESARPDARFFNFAAPLPAHAAPAAACGIVWSAADVAGKL